LHAGEVSGFFGGLVACLLFLAERFLAETTGERRFVGGVDLLLWAGCGAGCFVDSIV